MKNFSVNTNGSHIIRGLLNDLAIEHCKAKGWFCSPFKATNLLSDTSGKFPYILVRKVRNPEGIDLLHNQTSPNQYEYPTISLDDAIIRLKTINLEKIEFEIECIPFTVYEDKIRIGMPERGFTLSNSGLIHLNHKINEAQKKLSE